MSSTPSGTLPKKAFAANGIELRWEGEGLNEKGYDKATGKMLVCVNPAWFYRPTDVDNLWGDPTKAKTVLGWTRRRPAMQSLSALWQSTTECWQNVKRQ